MVQRPEERQIRTKRWVCHVCAEHAPEYPQLGLPGCTGKPLKGYTVDHIPVCETAAIYHANMEFRKHYRMIGGLADHPAIRGGETRDTLRKLQSQFREAITLELSGSGSGGVANLTRVANRIADFLAAARFIVARDLLQGAREAAQGLALRLPEGKARAIESVLSTAEADLEPSKLDPTRLSSRDRSAFWGAAKRATVFLLGDPRKHHDTLEDKIRRIAGEKEARPFLREFRIRQLMSAFRISREEAEEVAKKGLDSLRTIVEEPKARRLRPVVEEAASPPAEETEVPAAEAPPDGEEEAQETPVGETAEVKDETPEAEVAVVAETEVREPVSGPDAKPLPRPRSPRAKAKKPAHSGGSLSEGGRKPQRRNGPPPEREVIEEQQDAVEGDDAGLPDDGLPESVSAVTPDDLGANPNPGSPFAVLAEAAANGDLTLKD